MVIGTSNLTVCSFGSGLDQLDAHFASLRDGMRDVLYISELNHRFGLFIVDIKASVAITLLDSFLVHPVGILQTNPRVLRFDRLSTKPVQGAIADVVLGTPGSKGCSP